MLIDEVLNALLVVVIWDLGRVNDSVGNLLGSGLLGEREQDNTLSLKIRAEKPQSRVFNEVLEIFSPASLANDGGELVASNLYIGVWELSGTVIIVTLKPPET